MNKKTHLEVLIEIFEEAGFDYEEEHKGKRRSLLVGAQDGTDIEFRFDDDTEELLGINQ